MDNLIKITPDLDISFFDLMRQVDTSHEFTLRDVLRATVKSTFIPYECMQEILQCRCLQDYYDEAESKPFEDKDSNIDYLELCLLGDIGVDKDSPTGTYSSSQWAFNGIGKLGVNPDPENRPLTPEELVTFRESYAIELTPLYSLADYKIKVRDEVTITNWAEKDYSRQINRIPFKPSITLIEVLYWVFWELSFFGSPKKRDEESEELKSRIAEIDEAKKNGTLDQILIPWEDVKAKLEKEFGSLDEDECKDGGDNGGEKNPEKSP